MRFKFPIILVNFKAYKEATGQKALVLARICDRVARKTGVAIGIAVQTADIHAVSSAVSIPVFAQHVDSVLFGKCTGSVLAESVRQAGAVGTLINHSEKKLGVKTIQATILRCRQAKLLSIVCAQTPFQAVQFAKLKPDVLAIEPPELIAGKISVAKAKPELITQVTSRVRIPVFCGAGVHDGQDVRRALELGARGVLVANAVVNAMNPEKVLRDLVRYL